MQKHIILDPEFKNVDIEDEIMAIKAELDSGRSILNGQGDHDCEVYFEINGHGSIILHEFTRRYPELSKRLKPVLKTASGYQFRIHYPD